MAKSKVPKKHKLLLPKMSAPQALTPPQRRQRDAALLKVIRYSVQSKLVRDQKTAAGVKRFFKNKGSKVRFRPTPR